ncbi:NUDIX hydrolase [Halomonas sp. TD01]|uniref:NUDIX hydrolase n=1 Tax=Halomonas sp. TD01 TaxID=999141 RepID=UPI000214D5B0|nr:NUDIX domain-containing protein [Halomonas sp. TD01]EGP19355.1 NUDIX hydrolase [Halomonas sp. TD01]CAH1045017.1 NUDIX hydrolase [Halomonas sp. TD01]
MEIRKSSRLIIVDEEGRLLLFLYHDEHHAPFWATVGGELKSGEGYVEAAERELYEETGLIQNVGEMIRERNDVYAVARSVPARWLEQYFLVEWPANRDVFAAEWTDEEKSTIQKWKWWSLDELLDNDPALFKPKWLPDLLRSVLHKQRLSNESL